MTNSDAKAPQSAAPGVKARRPTEMDDDTEAANASTIGGFESSKLWTSNYLFTDERVSGFRTPMVSEP